MIIRAAACMVIAFAALAAVDARPSTAEVYRPWCVDYPHDGVSCAFTSYEQCMLTARGNGGVCVQNPWYLRYGDGQKGPKRPVRGRSRGGDRARAAAREFARFERVV